MPCVSGVCGAAWGASRHSNSSLFLHCSLPASELRGASSVTTALVSLMGLAQASPALPTLPPAMKTLSILKWITSIPFSPEDAIICIL